MAQTNTNNNEDDKLSEKKYTLREIEEPELQNLFKMSQNVFNRYNQKTFSDEDRSKETTSGGLIAKSQSRATLLSSSDHTSKAKKKSTQKKASGSNNENQNLDLMLGSTPISTTAKIIPTVPS